MKPIDKSNNRAKVFEKALEEHLKTNSNHPDYESSFKDKHYKDVFMALLFCQNGLCAYTESLLCKKDSLKESDWKEGKYVGELIPKKIDSDIEHFDSELKEHKGWLWGNLFVARVYVNRKIKGSENVFTFFKPDLKTYKPHKFLEYDFATHLFVVNSKLLIKEPEKAKKVKEMIQVLGLNATTIKDNREAYLNDFAIDVQSGLKTYDSLKNQIYQFHTAFEMSKEYFEKLEKFE
jgi:hypothetical protein